jgi:hypothetical protein
LKKQSQLSRIVFSYGVLTDCVLRTAGMELKKKANLPPAWPYYAENRRIIQLIILFGLFRVHLR